MSSIFKIFEKKDKLRQENFILKAKIDNLEKIIDRKDETICGLNTKLIAAEHKLANIRDWCENRSY